MQDEPKLQKNYNKHAKIKSIWLQWGLCFCNLNWGNTSAARIA